MSAPKQSLGTSCKNLLGLFAVEDLLEGKVSFNIKEVHEIWSITHQSTGFIDSNLLLTHNLALSGNCPPMPFSSETCSHTTT